MSVSKSNKVPGQVASNRPAYERPMLIKYGNVAELTRTAKGVNHDNSGQANKS